MTARVAFQIVDIDGDVADLAFMFGIAVVERTADDHVDQFIHREAFHRAGALILAVADNSDALADLAELFQAVGDVDHADALLLKVADDVHQLIDLFFGQRRGGFVQNKDLRVHRDRLGDFDHLLLGDGQVLDSGMRIKINAEIVKDALCIFVKFLFIDEQPAHFHGSAADEDVVGDRQFRTKVQFLKDNGDAKFLCFGNIVDVDFFAADEDPAFVRLVNARHDFHQRRFTCAVFTDETVYFALVDGKRYIVQRLDSGEGFGYPFHPKQFCHACITPLVNICVLSDKKGFNAFTAFCETLPLTRNRYNNRTCFLKQSQ